MGYLTRTAYDKLTQARTASAIGISADSFETQSNRTLTLGKNHNGATLHVFLKDGRLYAHEYLTYAAGDYLSFTILSGTIDITAVRPSAYAIPIATDQEFAELMLRSLNPLRFAEWDSSANFAEGAFFPGYLGEIFEA